MKKFVAILLLGSAVSSGYEVRGSDDEGSVSQTRVVSYTPGPTTSIKRYTDENGNTCVKTSTVLGGTTVIETNGDFVVDFSGGGGNNPGKAVKVPKHKKKRKNRKKKRKGKKHKGK